MKQSQPTTGPQSRRPKRTRVAPVIQPVRINEWKKRHGIEDFPGGITPRPFPATVYPFKPRVEKGLTRECVIRTAWPEVGLEAGDVCTFWHSRGEIGQLVLIEYRDHLIISRLTNRTKEGHITIVGREGKPEYIRREKYEIVGRLFTVKRDGQLITANLCLDLN